MADDGKSTIDSYVSAIVDLYHLQCRLGCNSNPHPRTVDVQALLKNTHYEQEQVRRANYDDRGLGTVLDGYTTSEQLSRSQITSGLAAGSSVRI